MAKRARWPVGVGLAGHPAEVHLDVLDGEEQRLGGRVV
jgi:hypothetical protein